MKKFGLSRFILSVSLVLFFSFSLLFLTVKTSLNISFLNNGVRSVVSVLSVPFTAPLYFIGEKIEEGKNLFKINEENKELKATIYSMDSQSATMDQLKAELESLKSIHNMKGDFSSYSVKEAKVITRNSTDWSNFLSIDLGQSDSIQTGAMVVGNGGLIGVVDNSSHFNSQVKLLTQTDSDDHVRIPVRIKNGDTYVYGILKGYDFDKKMLIVGQLNSDQISKDNQVYTSDLDEETVANIPVGKIKDVVKGKDRLSTEAYVEPAAKFDSIYYVTILGVKNEK